MPSPIETVALVFAGVRQKMDAHAQGHCGGRVMGIGVSPFDHQRLRIAELDSLPVLAWDDVETGNARLLCDRCCVLFQSVDCAEDLIEHWRDRPAAA